MIDTIDVTQFTSYTNKDFESIYVELLDLVKELTYKWDPSSSNESDPGVLLLKLNAIIADKCNYNIDQNILECFPLSVTQEENARQLFEQLGYFMHWYRSAVTNISLKWVGDNETAEEEALEYTIPPFTMVTDYDNSVIYTLVGSYDGTVNDYFQVSSQKLKRNGDRITFKAIQGIPIEYDINGETLITADLLDSNNRLYFSDTDIAENGIFITDSGKQNYTEWKRRDNLLVETLGNRYYKFGVSKDLQSCYIEFPDDIATLIGDGINITYIQSDGQYGNISTQVIEKFYNDITPEEDEQIVLSEDNVSIQNFASAITGDDPEGINSAYKGYKRIVGTFNTLITLRDYANAIIGSGLVSNGFVCDRTNDIQSTYKIMSTVNDANQLVTEVEKDEDDNSVLTAFSLKLYLLQYVDAVNDVTSYNNTFNMLKNTELDNIKAYISDTKSISHDYVDIQSSTTRASRFCFFKNKYPIDCNILSQYPLTVPEAEEVVSSIKLALYKVLNSKEINFGDEVTLDLVYDTIIGADTRIKAAIVDNLTFSTYAVYFDGSEYKEVEISSEDLDPIDTSYTYNAQEFDVTASYRKGSYVMYEGHRYINMEQKAKKDPWIEANWKLDEVTVKSNESKFLDKVGIGNYTQFVFTYNADKQWLLGEEVVNLADYGIELEGTPLDGEIVKASVSIKTQLRDEIYAKSVLAGTTQFFVKDEPFNYNLNQKYVNQIDNIEKMSSNVDIHFGQGNSNPTVVEYKLRDNENLQFYAPNLIDSTEYSNYVKYEYRLAESIPADADYQLKENEYLMFYWKEDDSNVSLYSYAVYGKGYIFKPSFAMDANPSGELYGNSLLTNLKNVGTTTDPKLFTSNARDGDMGVELSEIISGITSAKNVLSGSRTLTLREMNRITLDSNYYCYWILNEKTNGKYRLFEADTENPTSSQSVLLKSGEYFVYSSSALTDLIILGAGTEIIRDNSSSNWEVNTLEANEILSEGTTALVDYWFKIPSGMNVQVIENQYLTVGPGCYVKFEVANQEHIYSVEVTSGNATIDKSKWFQNDIGKEEVVNTKTYTFTHDGTAWKYGTTIVALSSCGLTFTGNPVEGDVITVMATNSWYIDINSQGSVSDRSISDFNIYYKTSDTGEYKKLDDISLVSHDGWKVVSLLTLDCSSTKVQVLLDRQSISYKLRDKSSWDTLDGKALEDYTNPIAVLSSLTLDSDGSGAFSTTYTDDYDEQIYLSLYVFEQLLSNNQRGVRYYGDNSTIFDFEKGETVKSATFSIPAGEYILKLSNPTNALDTLAVSVDGVKLHTMYDDSITDFNAYGIYYLYLKITDDKEHTITVNISEYIDTYTVSITNCYRYTYPSGMSEKYFHKIYTLINQLDSDKHAFDYSLEIDEDDNIENPLAAKSFFKSNHIYNKFTICQFDTSKNTRIYVTGKK